MLCCLFNSFMKMLLQRILRSAVPATNNIIRSSRRSTITASSASQICLFSSYEYPNRTEPPTISRTKATDVVRPSSVLESSSSDPIHVTHILSSPLDESDDPFDDSNKLSSADRDKIRFAQRLKLNTQLSSSPNLTRVTSNPPSALIVPPNIARSSLVTPTTHLTTLPNGIRVASQETYGQVSTLGVLANACGSRLEGDSTMGVNHLMQLLAFSGIDHHPSIPNMDGGQFLATMDSLGAVTFASSSLEQFLYCVDVLRPHSKVAFQLLSASILHPRLDDETLLEGKRTIEYQWMDHLVSPEVRMEEGIRWAAFGSRKKTFDGSSSSSSSSNREEEPIQQLARPHFCM